MSDIKTDSFKRHSITYIVAEFFNKGVLFFTLPIFTYLLSPKDYGYLSLYITTSNFIVAFLGLNLYSAVARQYHTERHDYSDFIKTLFSFLIFFIFFVSFMLFLTRSSVANWLGIDEGLLMAAMSTAAFMVILGFYLSFLQTSHQSRRYVILTTIKNILITFLTLLIIFYLTESKYMGRVYADILVIGSLSLYIFFKINKGFSLCFDFKYLKEAFLFCLPLMPVTISGLVLLQLDIFLINTLLGPDSAGLYALAFNISMVLVVFTTAFNSSWLPIFYKVYDEKKFEFIQESIERYFKVICLIALCLSLCCRYIVLLMSSASYYEAYIIVPLIVFGFVFSYLNNLLMAYAMYRKRILLMSSGSIFVALLNIYLNYKYIPLYGYQAAAFTTLFCYVFLTAIYYIIIRWWLCEDVFSPEGLLKCAFTLFIVTIFVYYEFFGFTGNTYTHSLLSFVIVFSYVMLFLRTELFRALEYWWVYVSK